MQSQQRWVAPGFLSLFGRFLLVLTLTLGGLARPAHGTEPSPAGEAGCAKVVAQFEQWLCEEHKAPVVTLDRSIKHNHDLPFVPHHGPGRFDSALAMNVRYGPILELRGQLEKQLGLELDFLKAWDPKGEAHVTVVTPLEYYDVLRPHLSIERLDELAREARIQDSPLKVLGVGCGRVNLDEKMEETYFLIVQSDELVRLRQKLHAEFFARGGRAAAWDPRHFYPHITIGYTKRD
ncbi:MAG: 2'-5' RNA ligase family protein, partial [Candidatus Riflebacteria bacterium]|nr:2'-5' RNA ligase family protein [Candidatus Riflebacteria bacterium]